MSLAACIIPSSVLDDKTQSANQLYLFNESKSIDQLWHAGIVKSWLGSISCLGSHVICFILCHMYTSPHYHGLAFYLNLLVLKWCIAQSINSKAICPISANIFRASRWCIHKLYPWVPFYVWSVYHILVEFDIFYDGGLSKETFQRSQQSLMGDYRKNEQKKNCAKDEWLVTLLRTAISPSLDDQGMWQRDGLGLGGWPLKMSCLRYTPLQYGIMKRLVDGLSLDDRKWRK